MMRVVWPLLLALALLWHPSNADYIDLAVLLHWDNVNSGNRHLVNEEAQISALEMMAGLVGDQLGTQVHLGRALTDLGETPQGIVSTLGLLHVPKLVPNVTESSRGKEENSNTVRKILAIDPVFDKLPLKILRDQNNILRLKEKISNEVLTESGKKRQTRDESWSDFASRKLNAFLGRETKPRLNVILVEEDVRFDVIREDDKGEGKKDHKQGQRKRVNIKTGQILTQGSSIPKTSEQRQSHKRFQPKFYARGSDMPQRFKTSDASSLWNLDRINQRSLPLDGNVGMPGLFFPLLQESWIYIIDTVMYLDHIELVGRAEEIWNGFPDEVGVCESHATFVAGVAAGTNVGVNKQAKVFSVRSLNCDGYGYTSDLIAGALAVKQHCTSNGGRAARGIVVNMSFGAPGDPDSPDAAPFATVLGEIYDQCDAVIVAAAGNLAGSTAMSIPAGYNLPSQGNVVAVGATTITDNLASFSNNGAGNTIEAPGVNVVSAGIESAYSYDLGSGTSFSAPEVAGVSSLHNSRRPAIWDQIFPFNRFSQNVINKMLADSVNAIKSIPNAQTTARLLQVNGNPIITTEVLSPVVPQAAPPSFRSTSDAQSGKIDVGMACWALLISISMTLLVLAINGYI